MAVEALDDLLVLVPFDLGPGVEAVEGVRQRCRAGEIAVRGRAGDGNITLVVVDEARETNGEVDPAAAADFAVFGLSTRQGLFDGDHSAGIFSKCGQAVADGVVSLILVQAKLRAGLKVVVIH